MFLPVPAALRDMSPPISPAAMPPPQPKRPTPIVPHRHDPLKDVRMFPAISPDDVVAKKRADLYASEKQKLLGRPTAPAWFEDPVALGTLLLFLPPVGLAALWSSKRYSSDARWALTVMTALTLCLGAAITIAVLTLRT
jgi:hypothetical protein